MGMASISPGRRGFIRMLAYGAPAAAGALATAAAGGDRDGLHARRRAATRRRAVLHHGRQRVRYGVVLDGVDAGDVLRGDAHRPDFVIGPLLAPQVNDPVAHDDVVLRKRPLAFRQLSDQPCAQFRVACRCARR